MITYTTFADVLNHGVDYLGGNPADQARRDCVRCALEAYRDLANAFNWSYLYTEGRVITSAAFDGSQHGATVAYDHSGGAYERMLTIAGDVWPEWAACGFVRVGQVAFRVAERKSATVVTLDETINPGDDLPAGTAFTLYRDTYLLPENYIAQDQALFERNFGGMSYTHPRDWLYENRYVFAQGVPQCYTITGDRQYPGRLVLRIFPWPMEAKSIAFIYKRRPRPLLCVQAFTGTVAGSAGQNVLTGTGTAFTPGMVGSVIRLGATGATRPPTSLVMGSPPAFETIVTGWVSATSVTVADPLDVTYGPAPYVVSDPVDIEQGAMLNAYLRCVEMHIGMARTLKDKPSAAKQYLVALSEAKCADSRSFTGRSPHDPQRLRQRLRDMPIDLTQTY